MIGLYVKDTFLSAYEALDGIFKERTLETLAQLTEGILMSAKNLEKVTRCFMLYTLRVNSGYRIIVKKISADAYILLYTGNHDDVYEWADKIVEELPNTQSIINTINQNTRIWNNIFSFEILSIVHQSVYI